MRCDEVSSGMVDPLRQSDESPEKAYRGRVATGAHLFGLRQNRRLRQRATHSGIAIPMQPQATIFCLIYVRSFDHSNYQSSGESLPNKRSPAKLIRFSSIRHSGFPFSDISEDAYYSCPAGHDVVDNKTVGFSVDLIVPAEVRSPWPAGVGKFPGIKILRFRITRNDMEVHIWINHH